MLTKPEQLDREVPAQGVSRRTGFIARLRAFGRGLAMRASSSLTRRIVVLNLAGLLTLLLGFLYLNQFRQTLIEARVQSLLTQGEIIAGAIAASATVEPDTINIDPDRLLKMQAGQTSGFDDESLSQLEFSVNPERVAPLLRRLVTPTRTRARIYDPDGSLLLDSGTLLLARRRAPLRPAAPQAGRHRRRAHLELVPETPRSQEAARSQRGDRPVRRALPARGPAGAWRHPGQRRAAQRRRRDDRVRGRAGAALPLRARRAAAVDPRRRHRRHHQVRALRAPAGVPDRRARHGDPVDAARRRHRRSRAAARRGRRAGSLGHPIPAGDPRLHEPLGRDRPPVGRPARHDAGALQPHRGNRALRRRRGARAQEPPDLVAERRRDPAARQERRCAQAPHLHHPARREAPRSADQRHLGRLAPRRGTGPRRRRARRRHAASSTRW